MTLLIDNSIVAELLSMTETIEALENSYRGLVTGDTICRPRIDVQIPSGQPGKIYRWGTMEGGSTSGYFAIRMKSDIVYNKEVNGVITKEKYCREPGLFCGLILLIDVKTGEPLAFINDGILQHMRVGGDGAIGVKYMARQDARVVGMLGSGGMARSHMEAFMCVRKIERLQVYSPTPVNREKFGAEMSQKYGIEVKVCDNPRDIYRGADIVACVTNSAGKVLNGEFLDRGTHVINIGGGGLPDEKTLNKVDVYFRFGNAPGPLGIPEFGVADEYLTYSARPDLILSARREADGERGHGVALPERMVTLKDILERNAAARTGRDQITYSERGNLQGAQFWALSAIVYEKAKAANLGYEIPTHLFLQDIRN